MHFSIINALKKLCCTLACAWHCCVSVLLQMRLCSWDCKQNLIWHVCCLYVMDTVYEKSAECEVSVLGTTNCEKLMAFSKRKVLSFCLSELSVSFKCFACMYHMPEVTASNLNLGTISSEWAFYVISCISFKEIQRECTSEQAVTTSTLFAVTNCAQLNSI